MKIRKAFKFRLYPNQEQLSLLLQHGGNTRFLWNFFLDINKKEYENNQKFIFGHQLITSIPNLKQQYPFLSIGIGQSLQQVGRHFDKALKDFLNPNPNIHKDFPVEKTKKRRDDSFTIPQKFKITKNYVVLPKIGKIKWKQHQPIKGKVKHLTISQDGEQWYCSVNCEINIKDKEKKNDNIVGIDVGLKTYATFSDGSKIENPNIIKKHEKKLKRIQRQYSRKKKGSNNKRKFRNTLSKVFRKVRNIRKDFQHKASSKTITKYDGVVVENLNIKGMMSNHCLAKSIQSCAWYEFKRQLKYKCLWNNKYFIEIDRFEPSSKRCSVCGEINDELTLKDREWICPNCGSSHDRDVNASVNIRNCGLNKIGMKRLPWDAREASASPNGRGTLVETRGCRTSVQCLSEKQEKECNGVLTL